MLTMVLVGSALVPTELRSCCHVSVLWCTWKSPCTPANVRKIDVTSNCTESVISDALTMRGRLMSPCSEYAYEMGHVSTLEHAR